jgi:predicted RNA-binding Zn ribbon-like protein
VARAWQLRQLISHLPEERKAGAKAIEDDLERVINQATSEEPKRQWHEISSQGLLDARSRFLGLPFSESLQTSPHSRTS